MIKVYTTNSSGKIEFTVKELEKALNEAYDEGYSKGREDRVFNYPHPSYDPNDVRIRPLDIKYTTATDKARNVNDGFTNRHYTNDAFTNLHKELNLK